jgi:hypothetical protein
LIMIIESEAMSELSPDRRKLHSDLSAREKRITDPRLMSSANKHRCALLDMHGMEHSVDDGPVWQAAAKAETDALRELVETPAGNAAVLIEKCRYLAPYVAWIDPGCEEAHAITDAVLAFLSEREVPEAA